jgi:hypothetical protein
MAKNTGEKLGELASETGMPIVCVARTPTSDTGMAATLAFQQVVSTLGLATFSSVASASLALQRVLTWQSMRAEFASAK